MGADSSLAVWYPTSKFTKGNWKKTLVTIHHMAGKFTAMQCANMHMNSRYKQSANYYVGYDGSIVQAVAEKDRSWCSSNAANDCKAVTIEVSNDGLPNWHVGEPALNSLIKLVTDICKRNNIPTLDYKYYTNSQIYNYVKKNGVVQGVPKPEFVKFQNGRNNAVTLHKYFSNTACPGPFLESNMPIIVDTINKNLLPVEPSKWVYGGLDYGLVFDPIFYVDFYAPNLDNFKFNPDGAFDHFIKIGLPTMLVAKETFNIHAYAYYNPDLQKVFGVPTLERPDITAKYYNHYLTVGYKEPRRTC